MPEQDFLDFDPFQRQCCEGAGGQEYGVHYCMDAKRHILQIGEDIITFLRLTENGSKKVTLVF